MKHIATKLGIEETDRGDDEIVAVDEADQGASEQMVTADITPAP